MSLEISLWKNSQLFSHGKAAPLKQLTLIIDLGIFLVRFILNMTFLFLLVLLGDYMRDSL